MENLGTFFLDSSGSHMLYYTVRHKSLQQPDPLAQSVEHLPFKQGVPRSSRGRVTRINLRVATTLGFVVFCGVTLD